MHRNSGLIYDVRSIGGFNTEIYCLLTIVSDVFVVFCGPYRFRKRGRAFISAKWYIVRPFSTHHIFSKVVNTMSHAPLISVKSLYIVNLVVVMNMHEIFAAVR